MSRVVVIGAGVMGLTAAYQALIDGHEVDVLEASSEPGGMAGHFDFGGVSIERFYCTSRTLVLWVSCTPVVQRATASQQFELPDASRVRGQNQLWKS